MSLVSCPVPNARENEDAAAATSFAVVVVDGATVPPGTPTGCRHNTAWYARRLAIETLAATASEPATSLTAVVEGAIAAVAGSHGDTCDLAHPGTPAAAVAVLREHAATIDYLVLCDVSLLFDCADGLRRITDDRVSRTPQEKYVPGRAPPWWQYRNVPGGYWVAAAAPHVAREALCGSLPHDAVRRAIMLTDGAARLSTQFAEVSWTALLRIVDEDGPAEVIRRTRALELQDPEAQRWPRGKVHDDATIAYCRFMSSERMIRSCRCHRTSPGCAPESGTS